MKLFRKQKVKQNIIWDLDDIAINLSEEVIRIINERYNKDSQQKTINDLKDTEYRSINKNLTAKDLIEILESDDLWNNVKFNPDFVSLFTDPVIQENYHHMFLTKGTILTLIKKEQLLKSKFSEYENNFDFAGMTLKEKKESIDMKNCIQIDTNFFDVEKTNARLKFIVTNRLETSYNTKTFTTNLNIDNLYIINDLKEFKDILTWNVVHPNEL